MRERESESERDKENENERDRERERERENERGRVRAQEIKSVCVREKDGVCVSPSVIHEFYVRNILAITSSPYLARWYW